MIYQIGDIGFLYPEPRNIFSCIISGITGDFTHCFQVIEIDGDNVYIAHSKFPQGIKIELLHKRMSCRAFDLMRIKGNIDIDRLVWWWYMHLKRRYDWLYYIGYALKKSHIIQLPYAYTCNEAIIEACRFAGIKLRGNSPSALAKDEGLEYISTLLI